MNSSSSGLAEVAKVVLGSAVHQGAAITQEEGKRYAQKLERLKQLNKKRGGSLGEVQYNVRKFVQSFKNRGSPLAPALESTILSAKFFPSRDEEKESKKQKKLEIAEVYPPSVLPDGQQMRALVSSAYHRKTFSNVPESFPESEKPQPVPKQRLVPKGLFASYEYKTDILWDSDLRSQTEGKIARRVSTREAAADSLTEVLQVGINKEEQRKNVFEDRESPLSILGINERSSSQQPSSSVPVKKEEEVVQKDSLGIKDSGAHSLRIRERLQVLGAAKPAETPTRRPLGVKLSELLKDEEPAMFHQVKEIEHKPQEETVLEHKLEAIPIIRAGNEEGEIRETPAETVSPPLSGLVENIPKHSVSTSETSSESIQIEGDRWHKEREKEVAALRKIQEERKLQKQKEEERVLHNRLALEWVELQHKKSQNKAKPVWGRYYNLKKDIFHARSSSAAMKAFLEASGATAISGPMPVYFYHFLVNKTFGSPYSKTSCESQRDVLKVVREAEKKIGAQATAKSGSKLESFSGATDESSEIRWVSQLTELFAASFTEFRERFFKLTPEEQISLPIALRRRGLHAIITHYPASQALAIALEYVQKCNASKKFRRRDGFLERELLAQLIRYGKLTAATANETVDAIEKAVSPRVAKSIDFKLAAGLCRRGPEAVAALRSLTENKVMIEKAYGALIRRVPTKDIINVLNEAQERGVNIWDPVVLTGRLLRCDSPVDAAALFEEATKKHNTPLTRGILNILNTISIAALRSHMEKESETPYNSNSPGPLERFTEVEGVRKIIQRAYKQYHRLVVPRTMLAVPLSLYYEERYEELIAFINAEWMFNQALAYGEKDAEAAAASQLQTVGIGKIQGIDLNKVDRMQLTLLNSALRKLGLEPYSQEYFSTQQFLSLYEGSGAVQSYDGAAAAAITDSSKTFSQRDAVELPYREVLLEHAKTRNWEAAMEILPKLPQTVPVSQVESLTLLFNCIITAAQEHPEKVDQVLSAMRETNTEPNSTTYNTVMSSFARDPTRVEDALELFETMPARLRDANSYAIAISTSTRNNLYDRALDMFVKARGQFGGRPSAVLYSLALQAAIAASNAGVKLPALTELKRAAEESSKDMRVFPAHTHALELLRAFLAAHGSKSVKEKEFDRVSSLLRNNGATNEADEVEELKKESLKKQSKTTATAKKL